MIKFLLKESFKGTTLLRAFQNKEFQNIKLEGKVIDLGARDGESSYYESFDIQEAEFTYVDKYSSSPGVVNLDLENILPLNDKEYDRVLSINLFEHIYNVNQLINEIYRILKINGILIGSTPFSKEYHPDPGDYYRFTQDFYNKIFSDAGFNDIKIVPVGIGIFHVMANDLTRIVRIKILKYLIWILCINLDKLLNKVYKNNKNFYCALVFYCQKS